MKSLFNQLFTGVLSISFVLMLNLFSTQKAVAQERLLPKMKESVEVKEMAKFAESLAEFYTLGDTIAKINTSPSTAEPDSALLSKFFKAGGKLISEDRIVGANSQKLVKKAIDFINSTPNGHGLDKARDEIKKEVEKLLSSRYVRPFFRSPTEVFASAVIDTDSKRISKDTLAIMDKPLKLGFYKPKFSCSVLATAIFAAELRNANKTAATVDSFFKAVCNANGQ